MKYVVIIDDDMEDISVYPDDPGYDGPIENIFDEEGTYHVEADSEDEAIEIAQQEAALSTPVTLDNYDY